MTLSGLDHGSGRMCEGIKGSRAAAHSHTEPHTATHSCNIVHFITSHQTQTTEWRWKGTWPLSSLPDSHKTVVCKAFVRRHTLAHRNSDTPVNLPKMDTCPTLSQ